MTENKIKTIKIFTGSDRFLKMFTLPREESDIDIITSRVDESCICDRIK